MQKIMKQRKNAINERVKGNWREKKDIYMY